MKNDMLFPRVPPGEFDAFGSVKPEGFWGVNFGGGVNSTALLLMLRDRDMVPDFVVFADTGSERPETYENVEIVRLWAKKVGFPFAIVRWIRKDGSFESIHDNAMRTGYLPSKAYGLSGCTFKWKIQPMQKWRRKHGFSPATIAIGYDSGEKRRLKNAAKRLCEDAERDSDEQVWYPLVGFGVDRIKCIERIEAEGWKPAKSSCFMCPNMTGEEWKSLKTEQPSLFKKAVEIQENAEAHGNADTASIFRRWPGADTQCVCTADGCLTTEGAR